jgi:hypothetical protein
VSASRIAAASPLQVVVRSKHEIGTLVVVILAELEPCWSNRRLGRFILHALFSQALMFDNATNFYRKSGVVERSAVSFRILTQTL